MGLLQDEGKEGDIQYLVRNTYLNLVLLILVKKSFEETRIGFLKDILLRIINEGMFLKECGLKSKKVEKCLPFILFSPYIKRN
jgi:hypothetical protein